VQHRRLYSQGIIPTPNFWLDRVYAEGNKKIAVLRNEYTDELEERAVDQVVIENGVTPNAELYWKLKEGSLNRGQTDLETLFAAKPQPSLAETTGEFHRRLVELSGNATLGMIAGMLHEIQVRHTAFVFKERRPVSKADYEKVMRSYRRLMEFMRSGDGADPCVITLDQAAMP